MLLWLQSGPGAGGGNFPLSRRGRRQLLRALLKSEMSLEVPGSPTTRILPGSCQTRNLGVFHQNEGAEVRLAGLWAPWPSQLPPCPDRHAAPWVEIDHGRKFAPDIWEHSQGLIIFHSEVPLHKIIILHPCDSMHVCTTYKHMQDHATTHSGMDTHEHT